MVFCIVAIVVFGIMGIFSAKYRVYAKEALRCVSRMMILKPCDTQFDQKMKAKITSILMSKSEKLGKFVYKTFNIFAWAFVVIMFISMALTAFSIYNLAIYGNCNGPESTDVCILNPEGSSLTGTSTGFKPDLVKEDNDPYIGSGNITIIEFGCHSCPYTKKAEPIIRELLEKYDGQIRLIFRDFPVDRHKLSRESAEASECAHEQSLDMYWKYHDVVFENQKNITNDSLIILADNIGLDMKIFNSCVASRKYADEVEKDFNYGKAAGVYGTPTFFIGNVVIVGPKPIEEFEKAIKGQSINNEQINACVE